LRYGVGLGAWQGVADDQVLSAKLFLRSRGVYLRQFVQLLKDDFGQLAMRGLLPLKLGLDIDDFYLFLLDLFFRLFFS